jgi:hypothetical protein
VVPFSFGFRADFTLDLDLILIPTVHLGVTFTIAFVLADLVLVLTWHALLTSATVSLSPFS